jgi:hypothetical protein
MNKKDQQALDELKAYLESRSEKTNLISDKRIIAANNRPEDCIETRRKSLLKTVSKPEYKESQRQKTLEMNKDPVYKENQIAGAKKRINNPTWKKNQRLAKLKLYEDPEFQKTFMEAINKRSENEQWKNGLKEKSKRQYKPVITPEGPFKRFGEAVIHYMKIWNLSKGGADGRMRNYLNDPQNTDFKWISQEEYIMLTGKDL